MTSDPLLTTEIRECRHCKAPICQHVSDWIDYLMSCYDKKWAEVKATQYDTIRMGSLGLPVQECAHHNILHVPSKSMAYCQNCGKEWK
jgi:hypothetical protein